jgi:hypothetical protein
MKARTTGYNQKKKEAAVNKLVASTCIVIMIIMAEAPRVMGSDQVPLDNRYHYNPCSFNPQCLCSTGGMLFFIHH